VGTLVRVEVTVGVAEDVGACVSVGNGVSVLVAVGEGVSVSVGVGVPVGGGVPRPPHAVARSDKSDSDATRILIGRLGIQCLLAGDTFAQSRSCLALEATTPWAVGRV